MISSDLFELSFTSVKDQQPYKFELDLDDKSDKSLELTEEENENAGKNPNMTDIELLDGQEESFKKSKLIT